MDKNIVITHKQTRTYHGIIEIPELGIKVFNHGTETRPNERTNDHISSCQAAGLSYQVIYEKADRLFGTDVISASTDTEYNLKVADYLNKIYLKASGQKAMLLRDWANTITIGKLNFRQRGGYDALRAAKLSETECIVIPNIITQEQLNESVEYVNTTWFFKDTKIRVSAIPYKNKTGKAKNMAAKPWPKAFFKAFRRALYTGKKATIVLKYKTARIQGLELAFLTEFIDILRNLKHVRIIITADDIEKHRETYEILKNNPKFEFIECESDADIVEEYKHMTKELLPDLDIMNPPFDGNLHLDILETVLTCKKPNSTIISVQPARWLEDPLAELKRDTDYKKYETTIVNKISNIQLVNAYDASKYFNITTSQDLAIYTFTDKAADNLELFTPIARRCLDKIISKIKVSLKDKVDQKAHDGWRCEIKEMLPVSVGSHGSEGDWSKTNNVCVVKDTGKVVFHDGFDEDGVLWYKTRQANGHENIDFLYSIKFDAKLTAENFAESCRTTFYKNLVYLIKFDQHAPLRFLPYMENYSHIWSNEDYCKYFDLDQEEAAFMCRIVDDYRTKDFINYVSLTDEV